MKQLFHLKRLYRAARRESQATVIFIQLQVEGTERYDLYGVDRTVTTSRNRSIFELLFSMLLLSENIAHLTPQQILWRIGHLGRREMKQLRRSRDMPSPL